VVAVVVVVGFVIIAVVLDVAVIPGVLVAVAGVLLFL
jgi:hypothetical protein